MRRKIHKIEEYKNISSDVWLTFKKYFPRDTDLTDMPDDLHELDQKYKADVRQYEFMQKLVKVYFGELNELIALRRGDNGGVNKS